MNTNFCRGFKCYGLYKPCCGRVDDSYYNEYGFRSEEVEFSNNNMTNNEMELPSGIPEQPEAVILDGENKQEEIYKDDFTIGFVPDHNHGSVDYTSVEEGHVHQCLDITSPPKLIGESHIHYTEGYTIFEDGHHHHYKAWSGPAIPVGKGMHVHYYDFYTTMNDGHRHRIKGVDMPAPGDR